MIDDILKCGWDDSKLLIFSDNIFSPLIYYSHLSSIIITTLIGSYLFIRNPRSPYALILFVISCVFCIWVFSDLVLWANESIKNIMFFWSLTIISEPILYALILIFILIYSSKKGLSRYEGLIIIILLLPTIILAPTNHGIIGFNLTNCNREVVEGWLVYYGFFIECIYSIWVIFSIVRYYRCSQGLEKSEIIKVGTSTSIFLLIFLISNIIGSLTSNWSIAQYGIFSMPIFFLLISSTVSDLKSVKISVMETKILIFSQIILVISLLFIQSLDIMRVVIVITTAIFTILGRYIILYIKNEVEQNNRISRLVSKISTLNSSLSTQVAEQTKEIYLSYNLEKKARRELEKLNETKDQFVSIAQHNLRIPITSINNRLNNIVSGKYGEINPEISKVLMEAIDSSNNLTNIANDFKDIAKLKAGSQILNLSTASLLPILESVLQELKIDIEQKKIRVSYPTNPNDWPIVHIDVNKIREVLIVIIENAIKYNIIGGTIHISNIVEVNNLIITIENSGIGITTEEKENILNHSFYRSNRAKDVNPTGMGIGLSVSRSVVEAHHGTLNIESKGRECGATVTVSLPLNFLLPTEV